MWVLRWLTRGRVAGLQASAALHRGHYPAIGARGGDHVCLLACLLLSWCASQVHAKGGCKLVLLGSNYVKCPQLKVKIGTVEVPANYHEAGTLWVIVPPMAPGNRFLSARARDGLLTSAHVLRALPRVCGQ